MKTSLPKIIIMDRIQTYPLTSISYMMFLYIQQDPKGPHRAQLSKNNLKYKIPQRYGAFSLLQPSEMSSLLNSGWKKP